MKLYSALKKGKMDRFNLLLRICSYFFCFRKINKSILFKNGTRPKATKEYKKRRAKHNEGMKKEKHI